MSFYSYCVRSFCHKEHVLLWFVEVFLIGFVLFCFVKEARDLSVHEGPPVLLKQQVIAGHLVSAVPKGDSCSGNSSPDVDLLIETYFRP